MPSKRLSPAQQALVADPKSLDLARYIAGRYAKRNGSLFDDYFQVATLGLIRAALNYDPSRGPFHSYAAPCVYGEVLEFIRNQNPPGYRRRFADTPQTYSAEELIPGMGDSTFGESFQAGDGPVGWEEESLDEVRQLLGCLPGSWAAIMSDLFSRADSIAQKDVAVRLGVGQSYVSHVYRHSIDWLREAL